MMTRKLAVTGRRCRTCGHLDSEHRPMLPSPCAVGWHPGLLIDAMKSAEAAGECTLRALGEETERQREAGACGCIGFCPAAPSAEPLAATVPRTRGATR